VARGLTPTAGGWPGEVLATIDWAQPWFAPWRAFGQASAQVALQTRSVAQALHTLDTLPTSGIRFVPQTELPEGEAYEAFIGRTQQVPTRDGLHDFFNGLCWARFPHTKRRLNALQSDDIARHGIQARRGPVRDALTLFDENAVLLQAPDSLWHALQARDWRRVFVDLRDVWQDVHLVLFGHALLEKLVSPYKSITGHVWRLASSAPVHDEAALDAWLAQDLTVDKLARKPFEPLPVLGIPGWWADNALPAFYDDAQVFRPRRAVPNP
jgi:hypothetical protein